MHRYIITFKRKTIDGYTINNFFVYATTQIKAVNRFCKTTGHSRTVIISVYKME